MVLDLQKRIQNLMVCFICRAVDVVHVRANHMLVYAFEILIIFLGGVFYD